MRVSDERVYQREVTGFTAVLNRMGVTRLRVFQKVEREQHQSCHVQPTPKRSVSCERSKIRRDVYASQFDSKPVLH